MAVKFKTTAKPSFRKLVEFEPAAGEKGGINFEFKYIKPKDLPEFLASGKGKIMADMLAEIILGWDGVQDENNNPVPYSTDSLRDLLDEFYIADIIFNGFLVGLRGAREKN